MTSGYLEHLTSIGVLASIEGKKDSKANDEPESSAGAGMSDADRELLSAQRDLNYMTILMLESLMIGTGSQEGVWQSIREAQIKIVATAPDSTADGLADMFSRLIVNRFI